MALHASCVPIISAASSRIAMYVQESTLSAGYIATGDQQIHVHATARLA